MYVIIKHGRSIIIIIIFNWFGFNYTNGQISYGIGEDHANNLLDSILQWWCCQVVLPSNHLSGSGPYSFSPSFPLITT